MSMAAFLVIGNRKVKLRFFIILAMLLAGAFIYSPGISQQLLIRQ